MGTVDAWRLQRILRELRTRSGLSAREVAEALGWSETRLTRLETTSQLPKATAVAGLLDFYAVTGRQKTAILSLVDGARQPSPWDKYAGLVPDGTLTFLALEEFAGTLRIHAPLCVPSVLMTTEYATAVLAANRPDVPPGVAGECVTEIQPRRQERLDGPDAPHIWAVLDESVLHRRIGSRQTMRAQLERLLELAERPRIHLQVLPFDAGWHPGKSPFTAVDFPESSEMEVVCAESPLGLEFIRAPDQVLRYRDVLERLIDRAAPARTTVSIIKDALKGRY